MSSGVDQRLTVANILPPVFICTVVGTIWSIYVGLHLLPTLQLTRSTFQAEEVLYNKAVFETVISQVLTAMFSICFVRCLVGHPGTVPSDPEWMMGAKATVNADLTTRETKGSTGDRRFCKWCQRYKPDRCHHCRICKKCVLKMDHHCPWIMNCVGFRNHKYFFLLVVYAVANTFFIAFTMAASVQRSVEEETPATNRFLLVLGLVLSVIMGGLMACFLSFHTWLMFRGMTTIEFCEKTLSSQPTSSSSGPCSRGVSYDLGIITNVKAVLGPQPLLWFVPLSPPEGTGISFETAASLPKSKFYEEVEPEWTGNELRDTAP